MTKHYLPSPVLPFNIQEASSLVDGVAERVTPSHVKLPPCVKKFFPIIGIFTALFGTAFLGFSFVTVSDMHVGYYTPTKTCGDCDVQIYYAGSYLSLPWSKGTFNIIDISDRNITVGIVEGNGTYVAQYTVRNVKEYIRNIILYSNSVERLETEIVINLKKFISEYGKESIDTDIHGLWFKKIFLIR